ncbi:LysR substrate-binding domain-containing protein, partial [Streptomyces lasiicapitis]|uniref:LysR substrate-binding domain-containing protein n=1 Tax=Streptomyces lasiicapitis TaxID=1923961 RepID=UPI00368FDDC5
LAQLARPHPPRDARRPQYYPNLPVHHAPPAAGHLAVAHDWDIAPLPAPPGVEQAMIGEDLCDLLVPSGHRLAGRKSVRRAELRDERWISQPPGRVCHDWLVRTMRAAGCEPDIVHQAEENPTLIALVAAGLGIALLPRLGRGPLPAGVVAVQLDPLPARRLYAVWRTGAARRPAIAEVVRVLRETWDTVTAADDTTVTPAADTAVTATADKPVGAAAGPPPPMS